MSDDKGLRDALQPLFASTAPDFAATLRAAEQRGWQRQRTRLTQRWVTAGATLGLAVVALVSWRQLQEPTLADDLRLAQSLSYEDIWRSPSDALLAQASDPLLHATPDMPGAGDPVFGTELSKEYL